MRDVASLIAETWQRPMPLASAAVPACSALDAATSVHLSTLIQAILNTAWRIEALGNQWLCHFAAGKWAGPKNMRVESRMFALRAMIVGDSLDEFSFFEEGDSPELLRT